MSFDMTVNFGGSGYFNFGNSGDVAAWDWEMETYFYDDGSASTVGNGATWNYVPGTTMAISTFIDLDNGDAIMLADGVAESTWDWTGALEGVNFFADTGMSYVIDNVTRCEGEMPVILCADETASNFNEGPICEYPAEGVDCDGN